MPNEFPDIITEAIKIEPGKHYTLEFSMKKITSDESLKFIDIKDRKCLLPSETFQSELFKVYSPNSCMQEERIIQSAKDVGCIPWSVPFVTMEHINNNLASILCVDPEKEAIFFNKIANHLLLAQVQEDKCIESCDSTSFEQSVEVAPIEKTFECNSLMDLYESRNKTSFQIRHVIFALLDMKGPLKAKEYSSLKHFCYSIIGDTSIVHIKSGSNRVNVIHQRKRVSFLSQLAAFGKLINLNILLFLENLSFH